MDDEDEEEDDGDDDINLESDIDDGDGDGDDVATMLAAAGGHAGKKGKRNGADEEDGPAKKRSRK